MRDERAPRAGGKECRFAMKCKNAKCRFVHPKGWSAGQRASSGNAARNKKQCNFGLKCHRATCAFTHPEGWNPGKKVKQCNFGLECHRATCKFAHPAGWQGGGEGKDDGKDDGKDGGGGMGGGGRQQQGNDDDDLEFDDDLDWINCPITFEVMQYPVVTNCGHYFERDALRAALDRNPSCPLCRAELGGVDGGGWSDDADMVRRIAEAEGKA